MQTLGSWGSCPPSGERCLPRILERPHHAAARRLLIKERRLADRPVAPYCAPYPTISWVNPDGRDPSL
jgi:hypothetical protein